MTEEEIIQGCIAQDARAQKMFYKKYKTYMFSVCLKYVRNKYEADDIVQEALISIFKNISKYKGDCAFKSWLYRITQNKAINHYNTEKRESMQHGEIEDYINTEKRGHSFEGRFLAEDEVVKAMRILQKRAPGQYTVFRLYHVEGMTHKEIAADIDINENTSKSQCMRGIRSLREILADINTPKMLKVSA
jgi:RNA polymerase sigma factor (sigma-70 family)